jgi:hypothetical protein
VLSDPARHIELDDSDMLRGAGPGDRVSGVGDRFVMRMHYPALGDYEMINHVVEYELDQRIAWEPEAGRGHPHAGRPDARWGQRWGYTLEPDGPDTTIVTQTYDCSLLPAAERIGMDDGRAWIPNMTATLDRLAALCEAPADSDST